MTIAHDYTGEKFGKLTALKFTGNYHSSSAGNRKRIWQFSCDCGNTCEKMMEKVVKGWTKSCGCLQSTRTEQEVVQHMVFGGDYQDTDLSEKEFVELSQKPCYWCNGWSPNRRYHRYKKNVFWDYHGLDRIDNTKPHTKENVRPSCWPCNQQRRDMTEEEFLKRISDIYLNRVAK
jgi:hypothetical protein